LELSTKPAKALTSYKTDDSGESKDSLWEASQSVLKGQLELFKSETGKEWVLNEGDGAFYGPKIDVHLTDSLGRSHQCGTIQLDYQLPERFNVWYTDEAGKKHRPVVLHRAILGSVERFMGILIEHYQGRLPLWLSDKQFMICSLYKKGQNQTKVNEYIHKFKRDLLSKNWRINIDVDVSDTHIKKKIKSAADNGYHYTLVVGSKEVESGTVAVRQGRDVKYEQTLEDVLSLYQSHMKY